MRKLIAIAALALASIASLAAFASRGNGGAVRGAAARAGMMAMNAIPTAADYVQDGLIAMWDGIENAGWGVHDANANVWKDLAGSIDLTKKSSGVWQDKCFYTSATTWSFWADASSLGTFGSVEMVFSCNLSGIQFASSVRNSSGHRVIIDINSGGAILTTPSGNKTSYSGAVQNGKIISVSARNNDYPYVNSVRQVANVFTHSPDQYTADITIGGLSRDYRGQDCSNLKTYCLRIYNRALTAAEIAHNYEVDKRRFNLP